MLGLFNDSNTAVIAVLPVAHKDPTQCSIYRPLSILNAKIKIFASYLEPHMSRLTHRDLAGFIKIRLASDNI